MVTVGLWVGLEFVAHADLTTAATAAGVGSAALVGAVGLAVAVLSRDPHSGSSTVAKRDAGFVRLTKRFADRVDELNDIRVIVKRRMGEKDAGVIIVIHGMPGIGKSSFAVHAANELMPELIEYARSEHLELITQHIRLHGHEGLSRTTRETCCMMSCN